MREEEKSVGSMGTVKGERVRVHSVEKIEAVAK